MSRGLKIRIARRPGPTGQPDPPPPPLQAADEVSPGQREPAGSEPPPLTSQATRLRRRRRILQLLALAGIAAVITTVLIYLAEVGAEAPLPVETADTSDRSDLLLEGKGVDFAIEREGRTVFHIRGDRVLQDREENVFLEGVTVALERDNGDRYRVTSGRATYNRNNGEAALEGRVQLDGPGGLRLRTRSLTLTNRGQQARSDVEVEIRMGRKLVGKADTLAVDLERDQLVLRGRVRLDSLRGAPFPFRLRAGELQLDRGANQIRANGAVEVGWGRHRLAAERLSAVLSTDFEALRFLTAHWQVSGRFAMGSELAPASAETVASTNGEESTGAPAADDPVAEPIADATGLGPEPTEVVLYEGGRLALMLDEQERPERLELEGGPGVPARLRSRSSEGGERFLEAASVLATFEQGTLRLAETFGGTLLRESRPAEADADTNRPDAPPATGAAAALIVRTARSERGEARFTPAGELDGATLLDAVAVEQGALQARADRADFELGEDLLELRGTTSPVELVEPRGELRAPHVTYRQAKGLLTAEGGVKARFVRGDQQTSLLSGALGAGEGPIHVESSEAFWYENPRGFVFRGKVQAWQGDNVVLADQLRGDESAGLFAASGAVRTVWVPRESDGPLGPTGQSTSASAPVPIEITAQELEYREQEGHLVYRGEVASRQGQRRLGCAQLDVELGENRRAERMTCDRNVELVDPVQGTATGDHATYDLETRIVTLTGTKVTLLTPAGNRVTGRALVYDLASGSARMSATPPEPRAEPPAPVTPAAGVPPTVEVPSGGAAAVGGGR